MIGHHDLRPIRNQDIGLGYIAIRQPLDLLEQDRDVECHAVADNIGYVAVEHTGRKRMQREFPIIIHDRMSRVGASLKADDDIRFPRQHIRNLPFSFISPVCSDYCFYHRFLHSEALLR